MTKELNLISDQFANYYSGVILISCMVLVALCVLVYNNPRIEKKKNVFYWTYFVIIVSSLAEWGAYILSAYQIAPDWLIVTIKCIDYVVTPAVALMLVEQVSRETGFLIKAMRVLILINAVVEIIGAATGWVFRVDEAQNIVHGPLYFLYIGVYSLVSVCAFIAFINYGRNFAKQNLASLVSVLVVFVVGLALQEFIDSTIRVFCLSLTFASVLLYIHLTDFYRQKDDIDIETQRTIINTDVLTGLLSRYAYNECLINHSDELFEHPLLVFSMDVNGLKHANDTLGHKAGDELIKGAADCILKALSGYKSNSFRTGGDEFISIVYADKTEGDKIVIRLREEAAKWTGEINGAVMSFSVGWTSSEEFDGISLEKLVHESDRMMYADKSRYYSSSEHNRRRR